MREVFDTKGRHAERGGEMKGRRRGKERTRNEVNERKGGQC